MVAEVSPEGAAGSEAGRWPVVGPTLLVELPREADGIVGLARDTARAFLGARGEAADDVVTVTSELVSNAIRHARGARCWLMLARSHTACTVTVEDEGPQAGRRPVFPEAASTLCAPEALWAEAGRGLGIVAALCPEDHGTLATARGSVTWGTVRWGKR